MTQSSTLYVGLDVPKDSIAVAYVPKDHHPEVVFLSVIGPRPCDIDQLLRQLQSQSQHLGFVYEADPCGYWLYRDLTQITARLQPRPCRSTAEAGLSAGTDGSARLEQRLPNIRNQSIPNLLAIGVIARQVF
jgi:hypothetical protein